MTDYRLVDTLSKYVCDPFPEESWGERARISKECAALGVVRRLRQLADARKTLFHYVDREVKIGTSDISKPRLGKANSCENPGLRGRKIEITDPQSNTSSVVHSTGIYDCTGFSKYPDIQLSAGDAINLFGRPTGKYEKAIAVVLD